jgi:hypothetical protein
MVAEATEEVIKHPTFAVGRNTLDLMYAQGLCWSVIACHYLLFYHGFFVCFFIVFLFYSV